MNPLRVVLGLAEKAHAGQRLAALADAAGWLLDSVAWHHSATPTGVDRVDGARVHVADGGSWATPTTTGTALVSADGASLLGASAREAERARRVAALREQASQERETADEHKRNEQRLRALADELNGLAKSAPDDVALVDAARTQGSGVTELETAQRDRYDPGTVG